MAAAQAPMLGLDGTKSGEVSLDEEIFAVEIRPQLVHEAVRAEQNALRAGTAATKSRGLVSGGRSKPWRQKGTGRARQGTIRAPHFTGGGHAFAKAPRSFAQKVNRKVRRAAMRSALAAHVQEGTLAFVVAADFEAPSTSTARSLLGAWGVQTPLVVVALPEEQNLIRSFRNLERVAVVSPSDLEIAAVVWARALLVSEAALPFVQQRAA